MKMTKFFYGILRVETAEAPQMFHELRAVLEWLDGELLRRGTLYLCGEKVGMADLMIWPWVERLPVLDILRPGMAFQVLFTFCSKADIIKTDMI